MERFFNYDNPILRTIGKIGDIMYLSILWTLCSIPIFTIGASTTALYYAYNKAVRNNRGYAWKEFLQSFKTNFRQSTIIWMAALGIYVFGVADCFFARKLWDIFPISKILFILSIVLIILETMWLVYVFPYVARFENTTKATMKNCAILALANFPRTMLLVFIFLISAIVFLIIPPGIVFVPGVYMLAANRILEPVFRKYMKPEDLKEEDAQNGDLTDVTTEK